MRRIDADGLKKRMDRKAREYGITMSNGTRKKKGAMGMTGKRIGIIVCLVALVFAMGACS